MDKGLEHANEFKRCLVELDVDGIRRLWNHVSPHLPQPKNEDEALHTMHLARTKMKGLHPRLLKYSKEWLAERARSTIVTGVGIAVKAPEWRRAHALELRHELENVVTSAHREGVDLDKDAAEVSKRMLKAHRKFLGI
jgi:hypothetical protein